MKTNHLTETKVSKSNNGKGKSFTYSTVIPKVIVNKFGLDKGKKLYWDIDNDNIVITPELPEEESIEAGYNILDDMLINANTSKYTNSISSIKTELRIPNNKKSVEDKIEGLVTHYNEILTNPDDKDGFKQVVLYLLDYPLGVPNQYEILQAVYEEITKTD